MKVTRPRTAPGIVAALPAPAAVLISLLMALLVGVAAGCGTSGRTSAAGSGGRDAEDRGPITYVAGKDLSGVVRGQLGHWNKAHPGERVSFIELPEDADAQRRQMIQNAQIKSDAFTVLALDVVWTSEFAAHRWVDRLPRGEFPLNEMLGPVVEPATYRGDLYGVPHNSSAALLYYRTDLLKRAGISRPPRTWAELKADCAKVLELPEAGGMSCYTAQLEKYEGLTANFAEAVSSAGGVITDENGEPDVDTAEARHGLDFLVDSLEDGVISKETITFEEEDARREFQDGRTVFMRQWPYAHALASQGDGSSEVAGRFGVAPLPGLRDLGSSCLGGHNLALSAYAGNKDTALDFMKFFAGRANSRKNLEAASLGPTYTALYEDPGLIRRFPYLPQLKKAIIRAVPRPRVVLYGDATRAIQDEAYAALTGRKSTEQALKDLQSSLSRLPGL